jgi:5-methylcytosine-specific restriction endonuclease McrA
VTEAIKVEYDTLTTGLRRGPDGHRTAAHYLEKWKRKRGLIQRPGGGRIEKFRRISRYQNITPERVVSDRMPRVIESEYHFYRWNIGKLLCVYCNEELTSKNKTQDHVIPRCRGGSQLGRDNLEPACVECNSAKGDLSLLEFLATR